MSHSNYGVASGDTIGEGGTLAAKGMDRFTFLEL